MITARQDSTLASVSGTADNPPQRAAHAITKSSIEWLKTVGRLDSISELVSVPFSDTGRDLSSVSGTLNQTHRPGRALARNEQVLPVPYLIHVEHGWFPSHFRRRIRHASQALLVRVATVGAAGAEVGMLLDAIFVYPQRR